jgi:aldehyde dehydrogenase (NAD+)
MPIFSFKDIQEPIRKINQGGKPLAIYYYGKNTGPNVDKMINETSSGAICINESAFHVLTELPFGGVGDSGMGKYHGPSGFDVCSHLKSVHNKMALNLYPLSCRFPPHT